ncbi:transposase [Streptomyces viridosporus ATCC 14672]|uniref:Transposase n=1 Tax=Streptomyces viridosporus (strain ATCC 14672 / DSM 40746 / JCM 4963 / KCTC 9882 / NRRL B-12104 / FH 1290) TaxID=566461 RepID=D6A9U5_STRV1|nr:transposase [Streptomyces viridosporus ATCC 14672]
MGAASPSYQGHRYPVEIISHRVWRYHRFPLSFREVEEPMLERGVIVSHETVRRRCAKSGQIHAHELRRRPRAGGHAASRRGLHHGQRRAALPVAGRRPARERAGHPPPAPARHPCRRAVLPPAPDGPGGRATGDGHRQAALLPSGPPPGHAGSRAPHLEVPEQPGREQSPAHPAARTRDEGLLLRRRSGSGSCPRSAASHRASGPAAT